MWIRRIRDPLIAEIAKIVRPVSLTESRDAARKRRDRLAVAVMNRKI